MNTLHTILDKLKETGDGLVEWHLLDDFKFPSEDDFKQYRLEEIRELSRVIFLTYEGKTFSSIAISRHTKGKSNVVREILDGFAKIERSIINLAQLCNFNYLSEDQIKFRNENLNRKRGEKLFRIGIDKTSERYPCYAQMIHEDSKESWWLEISRNGEKNPIDPPEINELFLSGMGSIILRDFIFEFDVWEAEYKFTIISHTQTKGEPDFRIIGTLDREGNPDPLKISVRTSDISTREFNRLAKGLDLMSALFNELDFFFMHPILALTN